MRLLSANIHFRGESDSKKSETNRAGSGCGVRGRQLTNGVFKFASLMRFVCVRERGVNGLRLMVLLISFSLMQKFKKEFRRLYNQDNFCSAMRLNFPRNKNNNDCIKGPLPNTHNSHNVMHPPQTKTLHLNHFDVHIQLSHCYHFPSPSSSKQNNKNFVLLPPIKYKLTPM